MSNFGVRWLATAFRKGWRRQRSACPEVWPLWKAMASHRTPKIAAAILLATLLFASTGLAATAHLDIYPPEVQLRTSTARQRIIVVATRPDGVTEDVTAKAKIVPADAKIAGIANGVVHPLANGQTTLRADYDGRTATTSLAVANVGVTPPVSFRHDVMPVFMRAGCNTGGVPRLCPRQGRLPTLAVWLRSGGRLFPPHARVGVSSSEPGRAGGKPRAGEGAGPRAAQRRQALRAEQRVCQRPPRLDTGRRSERPALAGNGRKHRVVPA